MPIYNSKQAGMVFLSQRIVSFYNETISSDDADFLFYYEENDASPTFQLSVSQFAGKNRCLQYKNFNTYAYQYTICPYALYIDQSGGCNVLFQTNFVHCQQNEGNVMCTFWSSLSSGKNCKKTGEDGDYYLQYGKVFTQSSSKYYYKYDPANIYKVNVKNMASFQLQQSYKNIFCAVRIRLVPMYVSTDGTQRILQDVAIIDNLPIVLQQVQANSPVFDFSLQGAGGGIKQHNHIPHIDGTGFAFAVFHPGTTMPQLSWSSV